MRDYEEKSYYEIQLDNKQLILVFLAGVTVCVLVFVLGMMVGKGRKEAEIASVGKTNETPAATRPEPDLEPPQEIQSVTPSKESAKKKKEAPPNIEEADNDEYTYLENTDTERPMVKEPSKAKKEETKSKKEETKVAAKKEEPKTEAKITEKKPEPEVIQPAVDQAKPETVLSANGRYTVQVMATSSKPKAEAQLASLQSKGYTAFMNEEKAAGSAVFKVRVGKFTDPDTAKKTAVRLKQELQLETWVAVLD